MDHFSLKGFPAADAEPPWRCFQKCLGKGLRTCAVVLACLGAAGLVVSTLKPGPRRAGVLVPKSRLAVWQGADDLTQGGAGASCRFELVNEGRSPVHIIEASKWLRAARSRRLIGTS